jgi:hypothetical protein
VWKQRSVESFSQVIEKAAYDQNAYYAHYSNLTEKIIGYFPDITLRFENLEEDFCNLCSKLGLPSMQLPFTRKSPKPDKFDFRSFFNEATKNMVSELNAPIISKYGYTFE